MKRENNLTLEQITAIVLSSPELPLLKEKVRKMNEDVTPHPISELRGYVTGRKSVVLCSVTIPRLRGEVHVLPCHGVLAERPVHEYDKLLFISPTKGGVKRRLVSKEEVLQILKGVIPWRKRPRPDQGTPGVFVSEQGSECPAWLSEQGNECPARLSEGNES